MKGNRREGREPPRPRVRPREGPLKRSMTDGGGEWLASQGVVRETSPPWASPPACRATKLSRRPQGRDVGVDRGALRWPWGGGSGEAQLGLGSGGREGWGLGAETQMLEDPARHERVGESGDAVAAAAARGAAQHVHREGPLEEPTGSVGVQGDRRGWRRLAQGRVAEAADGIDRFRALCAIVATTPYTSCCLFDDREHDPGRHVDLRRHLITHDATECILAPEASRYE